jgi:hypothetical protein
MTRLPSLEFCAFTFFTQWQQYERELYDAIRASPSDNDIRAALSYFGVSRTFTGLNTPGKVTLILQSLIEVRIDQTLLTPSRKVDKLAEKFQETFGKLNLSAASKLLWLSQREPFIIYDTRAVKALTCHFRHRLINYSEYSSAWREEYRKHDALIQSAVEELPKARLFMRLPPSDYELWQMPKETWFMERVFDTFLWMIG